MEWIILSIFGILWKMIFPICLVTLLQLVICKYYRRYSKILIIGSFVYLVYSIVRYYSYAYPLIEMNINYLFYGIALVLPYGSFLIITGLINWCFYHKEYRKKELNNMKLKDL